MLARRGEGLLEQAAAFGAIPRASYVQQAVVYLPMVLMHASKLAAVG